MLHLPALSLVRPELEKVFAAAQRTGLAVRGQHGEGSRAIVYDIPETFPDRRFGGSAVFDWGTWAWYGAPAAQTLTLRLAY